MNDARLIELETRLAFQDEAIDGLNRSLVEQQKAMDRMSLELERLHDRLKAMTPSPLDADEPEVPPHY
jgi:SlyX protein